MGKYPDHGGPAFKWERPPRMHPAGGVNPLHQTVMSSNLHFWGLGSTPDLLAAVDPVRQPTIIAPISFVAPPKK